MKQIRHNAKNWLKVFILKRLPNWTWILYTVEPTIVLTFPLLSKIKLFFGFVHSVRRYITRVHETNLLQQNFVLSQDNFLAVASLFILVSFVLRNLRESLNFARSKRIDVARSPCRGLFFCHSVRGKASFYIIIPTRDLPVRRFSKPKHRLSIFSEHNCQFLIQRRVRYLAGNAIHWRPCWQFITCHGGED